MDERDGAETEGRSGPTRSSSCTSRPTTTAVYMISLPRDAEVDIPAFPETELQRLTPTKINAAFACGARTNGRQARPRPRAAPAARTLTMQTINKLVPGGLKFNARRDHQLRRASETSSRRIGGVTCAWTRRPGRSTTTSNGKYHGYPRCPYDAAQGTTRSAASDIADWEALDYARQRTLRPTATTGASATSSSCSRRSSRS